VLARSYLSAVPAFYSIAWMYKEDYARAGIRMLPVVEPMPFHRAQIVIYDRADSREPDSQPAGMSGRIYVPARCCRTVVLYAGVRWRWNALSRAPVSAADLGLYCR